MSPHCPIKPPGYNLVEYRRIEDLVLKDDRILVPLHYYISLDEEKKDIYYPSGLAVLVEYHTQR